MLFSKRRELAQQFEDWRKANAPSSPTGSHVTYELSNCPENVIAFLDSQGWLRDKPEPKQGV